MTKDEALKKAFKQAFQLGQDYWYQADHEFESQNKKSDVTRAKFEQLMEDAIKEALAQPEPWEKFCDSNCVWTDHHPDCKLAEEEKTVCPFCSSEWVTAEQHDRKMDRLEQKHVAWKLVPVEPTKEMLKAMDECSTEGYDERLYAGHAASVYMAAVDVAPTPPPVAEPHKRKPLTDEEIILIVAECASSHQHTDIHFARAIEAAHGIKGGI